MSVLDHVLLSTTVAGATALTVLLLARLISPARFAQAIGGGLAGVGLVRLALVAGGAAHG